MKARRLQLAVAKAGALPMPMGGERTLDVVGEELTAANQAFWNVVQAYGRLRLALASAQRGRRALRRGPAAAPAPRGRSGRRESSRGRSRPREDPNGSRPGPLQLVFVVFENVTFRTSGRETPGRVIVRTTTRRPVTRLDRTAEVSSIV